LRRRRRRRRRRRPEFVLLLVLLDERRAAALIPLNERWAMTAFLSCGFADERSYAVAR
jgi:hypothetical protein